MGLDPTLSLRDIGSEDIYAAGTEMVAFLTESRHAQSRVPAFQELTQAIDSGD